jgi:beta-lactamase regulating signal transducer with metallopeptidase domain
MDWALNWIWQGVMLTGGTWLVLRLVRRVPSATRCRVWWTVLACVLALPVASIGWPFTPIAGPSAGPASPIVEAPLIAVATSPAWLPTVLLVLWASGSAFLAGRIAVSCAHVRRVKASAEPLSTAREVRLPTWLAVRTAGRPVRVATSPLARSAGAFGLGSALIVLPPRLLAGLADDELDCVVVHECAHLRRRDDVGCLVLAGVCAAFWWHPACWWIDRALAFEREAACDDWVVAHTRAPRQYASCLTAVAALALRPMPAMAPGMLARQPQLTARVVRLLDPRCRPETAASPIVTALATLLTTAAAGALVTAGPLVIGTARADLTALLAGRSAWPARGVLAPAVETGPTLARPMSLPRGPDRVAPSTRIERSALKPAPVPPFDMLAPGQASNTIDDAVPLLTGTRLEPEQAAFLHAPAPLLHQPARSADLSFEALAKEGAFALHRPAGRPGSDTTSTPWSDAASLGSAIGNGGRRVGTATAGFFTRAGKSIAGAF